MEADPRVVSGRRARDWSPLGAVLFDPGPVTHLQESLVELAARVRGVLNADLAAIFVVDESDASDSVLGADVRDPADAALLAQVVGAGDDLLGLPGQAMWSGGPVVWPRLDAEPAVLDRLAELDRRGVDTAAIRERLRGASAIAVPLATPNHPRLGAVCLLSFDPAVHLGEPAVIAIEEVGRQLSLTVRNHQWRDRSRRIRQVLEAVLESTPSAIIVTDLRERLLVANRAATQLLGVDLDAHVGEPYRDLVAQRLRWRFVDPDGYRRATLAALDAPREPHRDELRTVEGHVCERYSAAVRDTSGELLGRVEILTDVTAARNALDEAHRLADETARLRLLEDRRAREETALVRAAHLMASALTRADVHEHLLEQAQDLVGGDACAVLVVDRDGEVAAVASRGLDEDQLGRMVGDADLSVLRRLLATRRPYMCSDADIEAPAFRPLIPGRARSFVLVPLSQADRLYGVLLIAAERPRTFGSRELRLLTELATHAGLALQNAMQYEQERHVAETLQHALLPDALPAVPGLEMAGRYQASAGALVGGDFYGAWVLQGGEVAVLVGDVSGKGIEAAGLTAMVRYAAEGMSAHERDPAVIIGLLNDMLVPRLPDATFVALALVVIDRAAATMAWCSAGLPPPLLVEAAGLLTALEGAGPPCGVFAGHAYAAGSAGFEPGDTLFMCTDGLIVSRRDGAEFGEDRLRAMVVEHASRPPRELALMVHTAVREWSQGRLSDDVAIAVVQRTAG